MEKFIVGPEECFLVKSEEIPNLKDTQLYVDMSGVLRLYPYGSSAKNILINEDNLITVTWKDIHRGIVMKPTENDRSIFKVILMYNKGKYLYNFPSSPKFEMLIQCINQQEDASAIKREHDDDCAWRRGFECNCGVND